MFKIVVAVREITKATPTRDVCQLSEIRCRKVQIPIFYR